MGRYKRIPTKNRKKLKSVDPFNSKAAALRAEAVRSTDTEVDRACLAEAKRNGIRMGRFETVRNFVRRVERMTHLAIKDHEILIRQGLVGRKETDIATDFKLLEEKEKRRKEQSKNEIRNKIKAARRKRESHAKIKERNEDLVEKEEETDVMTKVKLLFSIETGRIKMIAVEILHSEVLAFGERYDAPPEYKGPLKDVMNPLMAKVSLLRQRLLFFYLKKLSTISGNSVLKTLHITAVKFVW
ncbi:unnamed protein product [Angiostrongylus costaricensis]|uniref:rRNA-processing protein efg1 n=1 Tax=Angiostrongylus costaricensis TaxID=334426 RepID=A0A0R3PDZ8_ANGCS|nr:unnamed protein product [Angiostrongylus costaricensis]